MVTLHIKVKQKSRMQQDCSKYFAYRPHPPHLPNPVVGVKRKKTTFSEHGHGAYLIKRNTNEQHGSKYFAGRPPPQPNPGDGVNSLKFNFFRTWSCCTSNKGNLEMQQHGRNILPATPPPSSMTSEDWVNRSKLTWSCCISNKGITK